MTPATQPDAAHADAVIETARRCAIASPDIRRLAGLLGNHPDASAVIERALASGELDAAVALMLAAAVGDRALGAAQVGRVLAEMDRIDVMATLVGASVGDRVGMLLGLVEEGRLGHQRETLALFLAVELLGDLPPPPELLAHLRRIGRYAVEPEARVHVGLAAAAVDDAGVREVLGEAIAVATSPDAKSRASELRRLLRGPVVAVLPAAAAPKVVTGFTVRRPVARVGRNEPCPCGSGKKYKHCCWRKDEERRLDPSPVAGLTMADYRARAGEFISPEEFGRLRPQEMLALDLDTLPTAHLIRMQSKLQAFRYWDEAEVVTDVLAAREDLEGDSDKWREELIHDALTAGQADLALRQMAAMREPENAGTFVKLAVSFLDPSADRAGAIERAADEALRSDDLVGVELAFALLRCFPALGILVTRALVDPEHPLDASMLLADVEEARDRLQLSPGDPAAEWYELRYDRHFDDLIEEDHQRERTEERDRLLEEVAELRRRASEATARSASLERALREATRRADELDRQAERTPHPRRGSEGDEPRIEADTATLRRQITDLKALIGEGNEERAPLRRELSRHDARLRETRNAARQAEAERGPDSDADGLELPLDAALRSRPLAPSYSEDAEAKLRDVPDHVARSALLLGGRLAAGEHRAWSRVKSLRAASHILSARVGANHRLLFEIDADAARLVVVDLVLRRDLEKAIARHAAR
jgi:hypothetical protein